jgi:antitoxin (DNA-binding transcriptional repressor) of toxin-antitoxin stability system
MYLSPIGDAAGYGACMETYDEAEAQARLENLIDRVLAGEIIVITRDGVAVVELRPLAPPLRGFV